MDLVLVEAGEARALLAIARARVLKARRHRAPLSLHALASVAGDSEVTSVSLPYYYLDIVLPYQNTQDCRLRTDFSRAGSALRHVVLGT